MPRKKKSVVNTETEKDIIDNAIESASETQPVKKEATVTEIPLPAVSEEAPEDIIENVHEKKTEGELLKPKNNIAKIIAIATASITVLAVLFYIFGLPLVKESKASSLFSKGEYEEAINALSGLEDRENALDIINKSEYKIAEKAAEYIMNNDPDLKNINLQLNNVSDFRTSLDYNNKTVVSSFTAEYKSVNYSLRNNYSTSGSKLSNGTWSVMSYQLNSSETVPFIQPDQNVVDTTVFKEYPSVSFNRINKISESQIEYIYDLTTFENPLYYTNYTVTAPCTYDVNSNTWKVGTILKDYINTEKIRNKTYTTRYLTIDLPEIWYMTKNEIINTYNNGIDTYYSYNYVFYLGKEKSSTVFNVSLSFSSYDTGNYSGATSRNNKIYSKSLGDGSFNAYSYVGSSNYVGSRNVSTIEAYFKPTINGTVTNVYINANNVDIDDFQIIVDSIKIGSNKYKITLKEGINMNIRESYSTSSGIVGKTKGGDSFTSDRAVYSEGYQWYQIGENRWICDKDGEWLTVN